MLMTAPRYEARDDCVLDSFGGGQSVRLVPIMGQTDEEVRAIVRMVVASLNGVPERVPSRIYADDERHPFLDPSMIGARC